MNEGPEYVSLGTGLQQLEFFRFSHTAMATAYEILISGHDRQYARQSSQEAFAQLDIIENELSMFKANSDIGRINSAPVNEPVVVGLSTAQLLAYSVRLNELTEGAFDITYAGGPGATAKKLRVDLDQCTAARLADDVKVDLGGIGKGWAVDRLVEVLGQWKIKKAMVNGGSSTIFAFDRENSRGWPVTVSDPRGGWKLLFNGLIDGKALAGSALRWGPHIIDPATGTVVEGATAAWAMCSDATTADALSTAFMIMDIDLVEKICENNAGMAAMVMVESAGGKKEIRQFGKWNQAAK